MYMNTYIYMQRYKTGLVAKLMEAQKLSENFMLKYKLFLPENSNYPFIRELSFAIFSLVSFLKLTRIHVMLHMK